MLRFTPGAVLLRAGISKRLAGPELMERVKEVCKSELDDPKGKKKKKIAKLFMDHQQFVKLIEQREPRSSILDFTG